MCCRYFIDREQMELLQQTAGTAAPSVRQCRAGDIRPSEAAPVVRSAAGSPQLTVLRWGWPGLQHPGSLLINARAETAGQKALFARGMRCGRILIPASGFYEWTAAREKHTFRPAAGALLQMAGLYDCFEGEERFVILTTAATAAVQRVHTRMPLLLEPAQAEQWLLDPVQAAALLQLPPQQLLEDSCEAEQLCLFQGNAD